MCECVQAYLCVCVAHYVHVSVCACVGVYYIAYSLRYHHVISVYIPHPQLFSQCNFRSLCSLHSHAHTHTHIGVHMYA